MLPASFPKTVYAKSSIDLFPLVLSILAAADLPKYQLGDFVNADFVFETSEGDISLGYGK